MPFKVVLVFNQLVSFHRQFGNRHLSKLQDYLHSQWGDVELVPIINSRRNSRDDRANKIADRLKDIAKDQKVHLFATSVAGIDARIVYNDNPNILSLSTFGTPHKGSFVATKVEKGDSDQYQTYQSMLGIDIRDFEQVSYDQMQIFNLTYPLSKPIFTAGGVYPYQKQPSMMQNHSYAIAREKEVNMLHENDGLFTEDEVIYGYGLGIYEMIHPQIIGMGNDFIHFRNAIENIRTIEAEQEY